VCFSAGRTRHPSSDDPNLSDGFRCFGARRILRPCAVHADRELERRMAKLRLHSLRVTTGNSFSARAVAVRSRGVVIRARPPGPRQSVFATERRTTVFPTKNLTVPIPQRERARCRAVPDTPPDQAQNATHSCRDWGSNDSQPSRLWVRTAIRIVQEHPSTRTGPVPVQCLTHQPGECKTQLNCC
jgi:hypothetical protein